MADKAISELVAALSVTPDSLFVLQQDNTAKKLTAQVLENWLLSFAEGHGGIQSSELLKTVGLVKTYRFTLADQTYIDIDVVDGRGVEDVVFDSSDGLVDTYRMIFNDGSDKYFTVTNGAKGDKGDNANVWIRYASQQPTADSHSFGEVSDAWIGISSGHLTEAPTDWQQYQWFQWKGDKGDTGDPATLVSSSVTYQVGDSGTIVPSGIWSESIPTVPQGKYLWTREVTQFNTGDPITKYSVARFGIDGSGSVSSVAGISPDENGNVPLAASDVKALPITGGTMEGPINMNGQKLTGLNAPTEETEPVTLGHADDTYATKEYADTRNPDNRIDNSNFTQFISHTGIGGTHGTQAYAGDRWILDSGTVTGKYVSSNKWYYNITLNGTIRQIIANPPDVGTVFVEMVSGTAEVEYEDGEVTITSAGGVIKNVALYAGEYTSKTRPPYVPKGYGAELSECRRYFRSVTLNGYLGTAFTPGGDEVQILYNLGDPMRVPPSVEVQSGTISLFKDGVFIASNLVPSSFAILNGTSIHLGCFKVSGVAADTAAVLTIYAAYAYNLIVRLSADL